LVVVEVVDLQQIHQEIQALMEIIQFLVQSHLRVVEAVEEEDLFLLMADLVVLVVDQHIMVQVDQEIHLPLVLHKEIMVDQYHQLQDNGVAQEVVVLQVQALQEHVMQDQAEQVQQLQLMEHPLQELVEEVEAVLLVNLALMGV
jgi:hypothetical protein